MLRWCFWSTVSWSISNKNFSEVTISSSIIVFSVSDSELSCSWWWWWWLWCKWKPAAPARRELDSSSAVSRKRTWPLLRPGRLVPSDREDGGCGDGVCVCVCCWCAWCGCWYCACCASWIGDVATDLCTAIRRPSSCRAQQWKSHSPTAPPSAPFTGLPFRAIGWWMWFEHSGVWMWMVVLSNEFVPCFTRRPGICDCIGCCC